MNQQSFSSHTSLLSVNAAGASDTGRVRTHNEDTIALSEPPTPTEAFQLGNLFILADGAGGQPAGETASQIVVETITSRYYAPAPEFADAETILAQPLSLNQQDGPFHDLDIPVQRLHQAFLAAHLRLRQHMTRHPNHRGMATTCLAAVVKDTHLLVAHLGDSRAYLVRPSPAAAPAWRCLTADHSLAAELTRAELLAVEQAPASPARHILTRVLGGERQDASSPDLITCMVRASDRLVLCCDGLWSAISDECIAQVVSTTPPQEACQELIRLANDAGGKDNISVIVLSFGAKMAEKGNDGLATSESMFHEQAGRSLKSRLARSLSKHGR